MGAQVSCVRHQGVQVRWYAMPFPKGMLRLRLGDAGLWVWVGGCYIIDGAISVIGVDVLCAACDGCGGPV